jgi:hypothetical protein
MPQEVSREWRWLLSKLTVSYLLRKALVLVTTRSTRLTPEVAVASTLQVLVLWIVPDMT